MNRTALIRAAAIVACLVVAAHLGAQFGEPQHTPIGTWDLKGDDEAGTKWIGTIVLVRDRAGGLKGHIDWLGSIGSCGREHVVASFDPRTRLVKMTGTQLEFAHKILRGNYLAELSLDGAVLQNGRWFANDPIVAGGWSASRVQLR